MKKIFSLIIIFILMNIYTPFIPTWNLEGEVFSLFSSTNPLQTEIPVSTLLEYTVKKEITKNSDNTLTIKNYLYKDGSKLKEVGFEKIGGVFHNIDFTSNDKKTVICPRGSFHPHDGNGNEITVTSFSNEENKKWDLKCLHHSEPNYFLAFYKNKGKKSLFGHRINQNWDASNEYHEELYDVKMQYTSTSEYYCYPLIYFIQDGNMLKLTGGKQYLREDKNEHTDCENRDICKKKIKQLPILMIIMINFII